MCSFRTTPRISIAIAAACFAVLHVGCSTDGLLKSRWAMDDPVYAEKYDEGAERGDLFGKAKQAIDARHVDQRIGYYGGVGFQKDPDELTFESGAFYYTAPWISSRLGVSGISDNTAPDSYLGVDLGVRLQSPSRIAPFVGFGSFSGVSRGTKDASSDGIDNDKDDKIDEIGETITTIDSWRTTIYPETGVHFWLTSNLRLTTSARYQFTSTGRDDDSWLFGITLGYLPKKKKLNLSRPDE